MIRNNTNLNSWQMVTLGDVAKVIIDHRGLTPKKLGGNWSSRGYRAISAKSIKNGRLVNEDKINILPECLYKKWMKDEVNFGDIFLTSEAPLGEHIIWKSQEKLVLSQRIFGIRTKKDIVNPFYLNYFMDSDFYRHELKSRESGSTVTGIKQSELIKTRIFLPPLSEQRAIASILSSFDDKIELLQEENKTLEEIAQVVFKEWFVKNANDNWEKKSLGEVTNILIGRTPPRKESQWFSKNLKDWKWISIKDMGGSGVYISSTSEYLTQQAVEKFSIPIIPENTVVLSFKMTVGRVAITTEEMLSNEAIAQFKFNNKTPFSKEYLYLLLKMFSFDSLGSTSSIVTSINSAMIKEFLVTIPEEKIMQKFNKIVCPIFTKLKNNYSQIQTLSKTRDVLLPKLMRGGEVRIDNNYAGRQ